MSNGVLALENWIFGQPGERRFTQESPVLPGVWRRFGEQPRASHDLLLTPHKDSSAAELLASLREHVGLGKRSGGADLAYNDGYVVARLDFHQLVRQVVPLSPWWERMIADSRGGEAAFLKGESAAWYLALVGRIESGELPEEAANEGVAELRQRFMRVAAELFDGFLIREAPPSTPLWAVSINREARTALSRSRLAVKADAAERVFAIGCKGLRWAIVDTGIDATHPAFRRRSQEDGALLPLPGDHPGDSSRVVATYDFTRLRRIVCGEAGDLPAEQRREIEDRVNRGRALDWSLVEPLLRVSHEAGYSPPGHGHGTHIAGIVGADWRTGDGSEMPSETDLVGICPDIELYDLRVFGDDGRGEEFAILAALQFVRHLNSHSDLQVIHGANLSLSLDHDLANYAVGRTPVCDECERLTASGVVVAVAAGNDGQATYTSTAGDRGGGFRTVAITDPGNAEEVITVGSTHRQNPHTYGVSYFSSRGPTGDGRLKPDLVAPGEKIVSPVPGAGFETKDGTSQATAHVSGVAAMLMARHPELVAQPRRIKRILCETATDLGRERCFQGAGLVDALRALQEV